MNGILYAADTAANSPAGNAMGNSSMLIMIVATLAILFFFQIWPQRKRDKEHKNMLSTLKKGDRVMTSSGMYGIVDSFKDNETVVLKIANNTKVEFAKTAIQVKLP